MADKKKKEVAPLVLQNGIFVAGHPRSGTSLACKLLESAGVQFLSDLGADQYNKDGYFELATAKELEKKLIEKAMTEDNIVELNKVVKQLNTTEGLTGLKIVHVGSRAIDTRDGSRQEMPRGSIQRGRGPWAR